MNDLEKIEKLKYYANSSYTLGIESFSRNGRNLSSFDDLLHRNRMRFMHNTNEENYKLLQSYTKSFHADIMLEIKELIISFQSDDLKNKIIRYKNDLINTPVELKDYINDITIHNLVSDTIIAKNNIQTVNSLQHSVFEELTDDIIDYVNQWKDYASKYRIDAKDEFNIIEKYVDDHKEFKLYHSLRLDLENYIYNTELLKTSLTHLTDNKYKNKEDKLLEIDNFIRIYEIMENDIANPKKVYNDPKFNQS